MLTVRSFLSSLLQDVRGPKSKQESIYAVLAKLAEPFVTRYLRIIPNDKDSSFKVMRAEIYGCFAEELPPYGGTYKSVPREDDLGALPMIIL